MINAATRGDCDDRRTVVHTQLREDVLDVDLGRLLADAERDGDLFVSQSLGNEPHHLDFARRERLLVTTALELRFNSSIAWA